MHLVCPDAVAAIGTLSLVWQIQHGHNAPRQLFFPGVTLACLLTIAPQSCCPAKGSQMSTPGPALCNQRGGVLARSDTRGARVGAR